MGDNYSARSETTENLLNDWFISFKSGDIPAANSIRDTIVNSGLMSAGEFDNVVVGSSYGHNGDSWLGFSSDLADDLTNSLINQDIRDQIAEDGYDSLWTSDGSVGKEAKELEEQLIDALNSTSDPLLEEALKAQLSVLVPDPELAAQLGIDLFDGYNLAALSKGEIDKWEYLSEAETASRQRWGSQCFLAAQLDKLAELHPAGVNGDETYQRVHMIGGAAGDEGQARVLINKLHARKDMSEFVEIKPYEVSQLSPQIEIYKVAYGEGMKYLDEVRMPFPAHSLFNADKDILESARTDYGISGVNWVFRGVQPDAVKNDIEAKISFYFQGFDSLIHRHTDTGKGGSSVNWSYLDLLGFGHASTLTEELKAGRVLDDIHYYEIRLKAGYNLSPSAFNDVEDSARRQKLIEAVRAQNTDLYLVLTDHNIDVNENGTIHITCQFRGRLEAVLSDAKADVLGTAEYKGRIRHISEKIEEARKRKVPDENEVAELQKEYNILIDNQRVNRLKSIVSKLEQDGRIYNILASTESLGQFSASGFSGDLKLPDPELQSLEAGVYGEILERELGAGELTEADQIKERLRYVQPLEVDQSSYSVPFFYFGDLVDAIAQIAFQSSSLKSSELNQTVPESAFSEEQTRNMKIILGPVEYERVLCGIPKSINLASVPISADAFVEFFYAQVIASRRTNFPLMIFMRQMASTLIVETLGRRCPGQEKSQTITINNFTVEAPPREGRDPIDFLLGMQKAETAYDDNILRISYFNPIGDSTDSRLLVPNSLIESDVVNQYKYMVLFAQQEIEASLTGNPETDRSNGIHHLYIGSSRGLLKQISFSKSEIPYQREARYQTVSDNPLYSLSNRYNINISMFGNNLFIPGTYIYLNPMGLGAELGDPSTRSSVSRAMGIGGYHIVTNVAHSIQGGAYSTTVTALWESSGGGRRFCDDAEQGGG